MATQENSVTQGGSLGKRCLFFLTACYPEIRLPGDRLNRRVKHISGFTEGRRSDTPTKSACCLRAESSLLAHPYQMDFMAICVMYVSQLTKVNIIYIYIYTHTHAFLLFVKLVLPVTQRSAQRFRSSWSPSLAITILLLSLLSLLSLLLLTMTTLTIIIIIICIIISSSIIIII